MYNTFFNLREKPFQLVPNPDFLFLGKSHEDALAHLTYAVSQGDGFVKITGEVGTGKTTLCRVFLEKLGPDTEAAFIFNSKVNATQLLKMTLRELGIAGTAEDPADLTHDLNRFLLEKKAAGKSVILLVDEAQNLEKETLEQLRMLSNLETTRSKLLQIILVGQPELRDLLDAHELRQLRQRINLSCHIRPLDYKETLDYIAHRISVASNRPQHLFTPPALKRIYAFSKGVPRLINIICDRSLLVAYSFQKKKVTAGHVGTAIRELDSVTPRKQIPQIIKKKTALTASLATLFVLAAVYAVYIKMEAPSTAPLPSPAAKAMFPVDIPPSLTILEKTPATTPDTRQTPSSDILAAPRKAHETSHPKLSSQLEDVQNVLWEIQQSATRKETFRCLATLWGKPQPDNMDQLNNRIVPNDSFFKIAASQSGLKLLSLETDIRKALTLDLPALFEFKLPGQQKKGVVGIERVTAENQCIMFTAEARKKYKIPMQALIPFFKDKMYIAWEDGLGDERIISPAASEDAIIALKFLLLEIGLDVADFSPVYDQYVMDAVKAIQQDAGLTVDGITGPETRIVLLRKTRGNGIPRLSAPFNADPP
ncbi:ExeA family protein [Desulfobacter latus]|uniref:AAA family ATPase n=1 Tax=Desulfobacter latus TaxID=2292 RepID=A0A850SWE5_9BACT|nr:ExeA family protein [Desulfobacter latus]NWH05654.1 AAA family ATPase [Desulfobacter latus]